MKSNKKEHPKLSKAAYKKLKVELHELKLKTKHKQGLQLLRKYKKDFTLPEDAQLEEAFFYTINTMKKTIKKLLASILITFRII